MGDQTEHQLASRICTLGVRSLTNQEPLTALEYKETVNGAVELCRRVEFARTREVCLQAELVEQKGLMKKLSEEMELVGAVHKGRTEDMFDTVRDLVCKISDLEAKNSDLERSNERLRNEKQFLEDRVTVLREERGKLSQELALQGFSHQREMRKLVAPPHPALVPVSTDYSGPGRVVRDNEGNLFTTKPRVPEVVCFPRLMCPGAQMMDDIARSMSPTVCDLSSVTWGRESNGWSEEERELYGD